MGENPSNNPKKCFITEEDASSLLQRYSASDVLTLLQEMGQVKDVKIDWNKMVRKSSTGITNAREYQMVWRHLAYQDSLVDKVDNGAQPLDDDSDLECELEAFPAVSAEASAEAAACAKVLIASGLSSNAHGTNGSLVEAPLTINIPQRHANYASSANHECSSSMRGKNIIVPISVLKQPMPFVSSSENLDITEQATGNGPAKKRRKAWSEQEDQELVDAVRQYGEGNWSNLIKGPLKTDRTAGQLSQRWSILKKKQGNINLGAGCQLSEAQLATRHAVSRALDMPTGHNLKSVSFKAGTSSHVASGSTVHPSAAESSLVGSLSRAQYKPDPSPLAVQCPAVAGYSKSRVASQIPPTKMNLSPDSRVKATAVAAGARIATPSDAASLRMAAQSKNAVHIKSGGGSMRKPSISGNTNQLPSNVHFIRTGLVNKPLSTHACMSNASRLGSSQEVLANSAKPETDDIILGLGASSQVNNGAASNLTSKLGDKTIGMPIDSSTGHAARVLGKNNNDEALPSVLMPEASGDQAVSSSLTGKDPMDQSFLENTLNQNFDNKQNSSLGTEAEEHHGKDLVSVPGRGMEDTQSNSLSNGDTAIASQSQANENGASLANGSYDCGDVNKDVKGAEKLEYMDIS